MNFKHTRKSFKEERFLIDKIYTLKLRGIFSLFARMIYGKDKNGKHLNYRSKNYSNFIFYAV